MKNKVNYEQHSVEDMYATFTMAEQERFLTSVDDASEVLLVDFIIDNSSSISMSRKQYEIKDCLNHCRRDVCKSERADNILMSKTLCNDTIELGGYVTPKNFNIDFSIGGESRLYDAIIYRHHRTLRYMDQLKNIGINVRAYMFIFSNIYDKGSRFYSQKDACKAIKDLISKGIKVYYISFDEQMAGNIMAGVIGIESKNVIEAYTERIFCGEYGTCYGPEIVLGEDAFLIANIFCN